MRTSSPRDSIKAPELPPLVLFITQSQASENCLSQYKMLLQALLAGFCLATAIEATPIGNEVVRFKRDAVLSARDLELADIHQVNLTESKSTD